MDTSQDTNEITKDQKDLLWGLYLEYHTHSRHIETLNTSAVSYMLLVSSALITVITYDRTINLYDLPLCIIVSFLGLITGLFSASYIERYFRYREESEQILANLDSFLFEGKAPTTLAQLRDDADKAHYSAGWSSWVAKIAVSSHLFWLVLPIVVFIVGVFLTYLSLTGLPSASG